MLDYELTHDNLHEVFCTRDGITIAYCATEALALQLCHLYEGSL